MSKKLCSHYCSELVTHNDTSRQNQAKQGEQRAVACREQHGWEGEQSRSESQQPERVKWPGRVGVRVLTSSLSAAAAANGANERMSATAAKVRSSRLRRFGEVTAILTGTRVVEWSSCRVREEREAAERVSSLLSARPQSAPRWSRRVHRNRWKHDLTAHHTQPRRTSLTTGHITSTSASTKVQTWQCAQVCIAPASSSVVCVPRADRGARAAVRRQAVGRVAAALAPFSSAPGPDCARRAPGSEAEQLSLKRPCSKQPHPRV